MGAPLWLCEGSPQPAGAFANSFHGIRRRLLHLCVDILHCTFHLFCLALELTFYVAGSSSESLFHLAANVFGITDNAIFSHEHGPSEIRDFNGWNGRRFPSLARTAPVGKPTTSTDFEMPSGQRDARRRGGRLAARGAPAAA